MALFLGKNLVFIDRMEFMNSSLDKLVKTLLEEDFKYLVEEFSFENLVLIKQKGAYPYDYMNRFERFNEEKLPTRKFFFLVQPKKEKLIMMVKYLTYEKIWDKFEMKNIGNYHNCYLKKDVLLLADVF